MRVKVVLITMLLSLTLLTGCSMEVDTRSTGKSKTESAEEADYTFTEIGTDKSGILNVDGKGYIYYYLTDTGVVYVGKLTGYNCDNVTPAISENGNYFKYNVEKEMVEEIIK